jgi:tape measure domain-containing protein
MATERLILQVEGRGFRRVRGQIDRTTKSASALRTTLGFLRSALVVFASIRILQGFVQLADSLTLIRNRIRTVTRDIQTLNAVQARLFQLSQRTRTSFEGNATVFARFARAAGGLNLTYKDLLEITEGVNQAVQISGSTAQEARNALIQFAQGLSSGALQGEELRSVSEQIPRLAEAIGREFGIAAGELIAFNRANPGVFVTERIIRALRNELPRLGTEFKAINTTIAQAFEKLNNALVIFVGNTNKAVGVTRVIVRALKFVTENLGEITLAILTIGAITAFNIILDQLTRIISTTKALIVLLAGPLIRSLLLIRRVLSGIFAIATFSFLLSGFKALLGVIGTIVSFVTSGGLIGFFTGVLLFLGKIALAAGSVIAVWSLWGDSIKKIIPTADDLKDAFDKALSFIKDNALPGLVAAFNLLTKDFGFIFSRLVGIVKIALNEIERDIKTKLVAILILLDNQTIANFPILGNVKLEFSGLINKLLKDIPKETDSTMVSVLKEIGDRFKLRFEQALKLDPNSKVLKFFEEFLGLGKGVKGDESRLGDVLPTFGAESSIVRNQKALEKLLSQIDPGIKNAQGLRKAVDTLTTSMKDSGISAEDASRAYTLFIRKTAGVDNEATKYIATLEILNFALKNNAISQGEFNQKLREARIALLDTQRSFSAGFERFFLKFANDATNVAKNVETILSTTFQSLEDELVQLATVGEFSFQRIAQAASQILIRTGIRQVLGSITEALTPKAQTPEEKISNSIRTSFKTGAETAVLILQVGIAQAFRSAATSTAVSINRASQAGIGSIPPIDPDLVSTFGGTLSDREGFGTLDENIRQATKEGAEAGTQAGTSGIGDALSASLQTVIGSLSGLVTGGFSSQNLAQLGSAALFSGANVSLFGANGLDFGVNAASSLATVPGGGVDNRLIAFRANDREEVSVRPKGSGGAGGINLSMTVVTNDADSFMKNQGQILNDGFIAAQSASRRFS